ncbi:MULTISPECIES: DUF4321 domain-containing protein [unclassified Paenibacillus]|uniref:DUF4321 domain-containing protein n=1 Tax=unclassified Paenibacillus TaxID=185978 RepID=UPI001AE818B5|nr:MULTISPECIES: DUF4321 domain-containing protein [unclassified Paenibacillus]MBP1156592.1 uncharacterized protein YneF (UPF0154 family) [Paenibacillus sp. PvP091]MBP1172670.1 uncharacterized protein YneF (UPF0154 family) [Paenibacillus sp. PvR098]MBP2439050.1 uncharacterized protein YneF (UPF0154 family) [Paenibacillus sp. PvP052]
MKKNMLTLILFLIVGLVAGTLVGQLLAPYPGLSFLTKSVELTWQPKADLLVIRYDLNLYIRLNLISIAGLALGFWLHRRL